MNVDTVVAKALREKVVINENGQRKLVTKLEAAIKQLMNKAASGDLRALNQLVQLLHNAEAKQASGDAPAPALNDLDQQVIADILSRLQVTPDGTQQPQQDAEKKEEDRGKSGPR